MPAISPLSSPITYPARALTGTNSRATQVSDLEMNRLPSRQNTATEISECVICTDVMDNPVDLRKLDCNHEYHKACINRWELTKPRQAMKCPICRGGINEIGTTTTTTPSQNTPRPPQMNQRRNSQSFRTCQLLCNFCLAVVTIGAIGTLAYGMATLAFSSNSKN